MPQTEKGLGNSQTLCVALPELEFEPLEKLDGRATVIRFRVRNQAVRQGDTLLVLEGSDIQFHGFIGSIDADGWAIATDRRGSCLAAG